jgi:hypothetical protein
MSGSALTAGRPSLMVDGSDQGCCAAPRLIRLVHAVPQRSKNAYLDARKESKVRVVSEARRFEGHSAVRVLARPACCPLLMR